MIHNRKAEEQSDKKIVLMMSTIESDDLTLIDTGRKSSQETSMCTRL